MTRKKLGTKYIEKMKEKESENNFCCRRALGILIRNTKSIENLNLTERTIEDYETEFGYDLTEYKKRIDEMRRGYQS